MPLSHKWLRQVLTDRGVAAPTEAACAAFVRTLDEAGQRQVRLFLDAVIKGVESTDDMLTFLTAIQAASPTNEAPSDDTPGPSTQAAALHPRPSVRQFGATAPVRSTTKVSSVPAPESDQRAKLREQGMHIYAGKAAMKVELDVLRGGDGESSRLTVQIELAPAKGPRAYDWARKIPFQFTRKELPLLGAMLMGYAGDILVLTNHGPEHDKRLELRQQAGSIFVKLRQGTKTLAMPVEAADLFGWVALTITALKNHHEALDSGALFEMLKRTGAMHAAASTQTPTNDRNP